MAISRLLALLLLAGCSTVPRGELPEWAAVAHKTDILGPATSSSRALWLASHGEWGSALQLCEEGVESGSLDLRELEQLGVLLLQQGLKGSQEEQLLTLIGAGIAQNLAVRSILEEACSSGHPMVQLHALTALASDGDDEIDPFLIRAMGSPWIPVRLTAAHLLASKRSPAVIEQVEAMYYKLPHEVRPYLAPLLAQVNTSEAITLLIRLAQDQRAMVRIAAVHSLAQAHRDDEALRILAMMQQDQGAEAEACAYALGHLHDTRALPHLHRLLNSGELTTRIAAAQALWSFGDEEALKALLWEARGGHPFAVMALDHIKEGIPVLVDLLDDPRRFVQINAALALLQHRDRRALPVIEHWLTSDPHVMPLVPAHSPGGALQAYGSRSLTEEEFPVALMIRQRVLSQCIELPEEDFLRLAARLYAEQSIELIPLLTRLLENLQTPAALELLHQERQRTGGPLSRAYATLALYRLNEPGPWEESLMRWLEEHHKTELIQLQPEAPWDPENLDAARYSLSTQQTSQLFIETLEALAQHPSGRGRGLILRVIRQGHPRNRFVLAGILMRMSL
ncbi:MAG: HEAT repeat domain-containing protein [Chlamydiia bacterium]